MSQHYTKTTYREYLRTPHWQGLRRQVRERAEGKCEVLWCNRQGRDTHHLTYERIGNERLDDLVLLCRRCHCLAHRRWLKFFWYWVRGE